MPNGTGGQFPSPPTSAPTPETSPEEVKLTDEVAPNLSAPPPTMETPTPTPAPQLVPIAAPPAKRGFPLLTFLLILIAIGASAATYFFYQQSQNLNTQLESLQRTIEQQKITPTPEITLSPIPEGTISATPTATTTATLTPSPTIKRGPARSAFDQISEIIATAQTKYPNAQLLMITGSNVQSDSQIILKYWLRQTATDKKYLYILKEPDKELSLVDQNVFVTPDNNIPSLNQDAQNGTLGIDLIRAHQIALNTCPSNYDCAGGIAEAKFINFNTILWQISIKAPGKTTPFVVRIDSKTEKILFQSQ